jgi:hypothetical protein
MKRTERTSVSELYTDRFRLRSLMDGSCKQDAQITSGHSPAALECNRWDPRGETCFKHHALSCLTQAKP